MKFNRAIDDVVLTIQDSPDTKWNPIEQPKDVVQSCRSEREGIEAAYKAELRAVDDKYGGLESAWGASRREILRNNYGVEKINARNSALSKLWEIESECRSKADALGKEISRQVKLHVAGGG